MLHSPMELASGKWYSLLSSLGINSEYLKNKHGPCPMCGGKDRFRWDNKEGKGTFICNQCGAGDGYRLLEMYHGWSFLTALQEVKQLIPNVVEESFKSKINDRKKIEAARKTWEESLVVEEGDPVWNYLHHRTGIRRVYKWIRYHPALPYVSMDGEVTYHPAMIALVLSANGKEGLTIHRTYLTEEGRKASVESPKKIMACSSIQGGAIRLYKHTDTLGVAEGIETSICASKLFKIPVWSLISSPMFKSFVPPEEVKKLIIFSDNDGNFTGQSAAFDLANKMALKGIQVEVKVPPKPNSDWADYEDHQAQ